MPQPVKQPINIDFSKGLNLKVDPFQVSPGNFLSLVNSVFNKVGRLTKRNGFPKLLPLPNTTTSYLTTFNDDLQALGPQLLSLSSGQDAWINKGSTYPLSLDTLPLIRNSTNQTQSDTAIAANGVICTVYTETASSTSYKYALADSITGQNIVAPTLIPAAGGTVTNAPRVFLLGNNFIILFENLFVSTQHLQFIAISSFTGQIIKTNTDISTSFTNSTTLAYDAAVANNNLYVAWNGASASGINLAFVSNSLTVSSVVNPDASHQATIMSVTVDVTQALPTVWVSYYNSGSSTGYTFARDINLNTVLGPTQIISSGTVLNITSAAENGVNQVFYEVSNTYSYDSSIHSNYIESNTITQAGTVGTAYTAVRSVGLASKAVILAGVIYFLAAYSSLYQPTYFLINGSTSVQANPIIVAKLAYSNGGGYVTTGLPNLYINPLGSPSTSYLFKDLIASVNKNTNVPTGSQVNGIYSQTGVNLVNFAINTDGLTSVEIGQDLHLTGGFLWMYDGYLPVEHSFFVWPDSVEATWSTSGGSIHAQPDGSTNTNAYYYQVTYEWTDNQGNAFRSAPSIPVAVTTTGSGTSGSITVNVPTLRLTYKTANPVKISIYRWSVAQQSYYQVTSISAPQLNSLTSDSIAFVDTLADATILGNNLLYTTGGVVEDISAPSSSIMDLFDDRLWLVDAEDPNLLWFSKQVIEATPVEMSDLFTVYVAPSTGAEGSTGKITALYPMDDKQIIFKESAIYYINGTGPDNTGANSTYSQPIFITASVGCSNPKSIVLMPDGLMFQSSKGIWLLGRDLSTRYIGADVEDFNSFTVTSAAAIPNTNEVRFALSNGLTLMYDYFVHQWGEFEGIPSVSSTLYNKLHTIATPHGEVWQEAAGVYLDGSNPVLMSFQTSWLNIAGLRGYLRAYWFYFLGTYLSPHKMQINIAYDYDLSSSQGNLIAPLNYSGPFGTDPYYGGTGSGSFGGQGSLYNWRVFLDRQRCKSFQITMQEVFDPQFGTVAGPGLTLSGLNCIVGLKKAYAPINQNQQVG
jgi:hypothetical protein